MARIAGVNIPREKRVEIGLTYIYGIGRSTAQSVCKELGIGSEQKVRDLTDEEVARIRAYIDSNVQVEGDLRRDALPSGRWTRDHRCSRRIPAGPQRLSCPQTAPGLRRL